MIMNDRCVGGQPLYPALRLGMRVMKWNVDERKGKCDAGGNSRLVMATKG